MATVENASFPVVRRGYDRNQVDDQMSWLAADLAEKMERTN